MRGEQRSRQGWGGESFRQCPYRQAGRQGSKQYVAELLLVVVVVESEK